MLVSVLINVILAEIFFSHCCAVQKNGTPQKHIIQETFQALSLPVHDEFTSTSAFLILWAQRQLFESR